MIRNVTGDLLKDDADALVNAVNTAGVMGKGIALQFKKTWPEMFKAYAAACRNGEVELGHMHVWRAGSGRYIINFPTKQHWRSRSTIPGIESGLQDLVEVIRTHYLTSLALPPLGCGHGGLTWPDVEPVIHRALTPIATDVDVRIYAPPKP